MKIGQHVRVKRGDADPVDALVYEKQRGDRFSVVIVEPLPGRPNNGRRAVLEHLSAADLEGEASATEPKPEPNPADAGQV